MFDNLLYFSFNVIFPALLATNEGMTTLEKELIASLKQGDQKSFELVFKTFYPRLCTYAFDYTRQLETAEDLVKDFFLNFWINRESLEISSSLSGYLFRSVHNSCINYLKRVKSKNKLLPVDDLSLIELKCRQPLTADYPAGHLLACELEGIIYQEIEKLPEQCREIFKLSRFEGLPHKKIASQLNISENTVKVQIYNALKKIREVLPWLFYVLLSLVTK